MTAKNAFDSAGKRAVRESWDTPVLRLLNQKLGFRFRYMGLPGVDLLDIKLWQEMIDEVIAFEIPARATRNDPQGRRNIVALRRNLHMLGIPGHAFFGPMEEVVVLREDYDGSRYTQNKVITLYNLDFCDEVASRISTRQQGEQMWRFEAIRQILRDQSLAFQDQGSPSHFMLLLTVRDQIDAEKLRGFLSEQLYEDTRSYVAACGGTSSLPASGFILGTHTWALKAFIYDTLRQYLANPNISATFFPIVRYQGTPVRTGKRTVLDSPMLHCMILCRFGEYQTPTPSYLPGEYLTAVSSVSVSSQGELRWEPQPGEPPTPRGSPSSSLWFQEFGSSFLNGPS